jgi:hypothetical protein
MAGSLDGRKTMVIGREDYDYLIIRKDVAEVWVSPNSNMSCDEIAAELRRVAVFVEEAGA